MKKLIVFVVAILSVFTGFAQDKYVVSAGVAINAGKVEDAKEDIDKAWANADTRTKPKALLVRSEVYMAMQTMPKYADSKPYKEGVTALFKLLEVKPDYEKETVDQLLFGAFGFNYKDGMKLYKDKSYADASECMKMVLKVCAMDRVKKMVEQIPEPIKGQIDTAVARSLSVQAQCSYFLGNYDEAITLLEKAKSNPITKTPDVYVTLIESYNNKKNSEKASATIEEARKAFPDDAEIRKLEMNSLLTSGSNDDKIKKLEERVAQDPNNATLLYQLAIVCQASANPQGAPAPANKEELLAKAEDAFKRSLKIDDKNATCYYDLGGVYFYQAVDFNKAMNDITGSSSADQKKYDGLKAKRDEMFTKATPYYEKAYELLQPKEKELSDKDHATYKHTILALKEVYARTGKMDKSDEMKKKYESL